MPFIFENNEILRHFLSFISKKERDLKYKKRISADLSFFKKRKREKEKKRKNDRSKKTMPILEDQGDLNLKIKTTMYQKKEHLKGR